MWQEKEERTIRMECVKEWKEEAKTCPRAARCCAKHGGRWLTSSRHKRNGSSPSGAVKRVDRQRAMSNSASRLTWKMLDPEE